MAMLLGSSFQGWRLTVDGGRCLKLKGMGDQFVLSIDDGPLTAETLIALYTKNSANKPTKQDSSSVETPSIDLFAHGLFSHGHSTDEYVMCRICHDEDEDCNLETPCSCCGSLKYAHRKCIQKWCDAKGDTLCEICLQPFKPGYTVPSHLFHYGGVPMNFSWEMSQRDDNNMVGDNDDDSSPTTSGTSVLYCRCVAVIFMILLVLRHTLPIIISGQNNYSSDQFAIIILRIVGILLPIYAMVKLVSYFHLRSRRLRRETRHFPSGEQGNEDSTNLQMQQPRPDLLHM